MRRRREQSEIMERESKSAELPDGNGKHVGGSCETLERPAAVAGIRVSTSSPPDPESVELWPERVEAAALLAELINHSGRFIVFRQDTTPPRRAVDHVYVIHAIRPLLPPGRDFADAIAGKHGCWRSHTSDAPPVSGVELTGPALTHGGTHHPTCSSTKPTICFAQADLNTSSRRLEPRHQIHPRAGVVRG